jgi:hypothetical protein
MVMSIGPAASPALALEVPKAGFPLIKSSVVAWKAH